MYRTILIGKEKFSETIHAVKAVLSGLPEYHYEDRPKTPEDLYDFLIWTYAPDGPDTEDYFNDEENMF